MQILDISGFGVSLTRSGFKETNLQESHWMGANPKNNLLTIVNIMWHDDWEKKTLIFIQPTT